MHPGAKYQLQLLTDVPVEITHLFYGNPLLRENQFMVSVEGLKLDNSTRGMNRKRNLVQDIPGCTRTAKTRKQIPHSFKGCKPKFSEELHVYHAKQTAAFTKPATCQTSQML